MPDTEPKKTHLYDWHVSQGAKMVDFAGYALPVSYELGLKGEHEACRNLATLFDVSHMGQVSVTGSETIQFLSKLMPLDSANLAVGTQAYSFLLNDQGGVLDDLMCARLADNRFEIVVNGACKTADVAHMHAVAEGFDVEINVRDRSLVALQGPKAAEALAQTHLAPACDLKFMQVCEPADNTLVSRSGYTGEDGFEIAIPHDQVVALADQLSAMDLVEPAGLGARDTLRLEAGLPLYGQDLTTDITPLDAMLGWAIPKDRTGYIGAEALAAQRASSPAKARVAILPDGRAPLRAGVPLFDESGAPIGHVTSGTLSPTLGQPIALALVDKAAAKNDTFTGELRGKSVSAIRTKLPFVKKSYAK